MGYKLTIRIRGKSSI